MSTIVDLIQNLALLVALSVVASMSGRHRIPRLHSAFVQGALLGSVAVAGMLNAMSMGPGIQFDGRSVALSLCGLFFGPWAALVAATMAATCRILQGGVGMPVGLVGIVFAASIGSLFHLRRGRDIFAISNLQLWGFGLLVHVVLLLSSLFLPDRAVEQIFLRIAGPLLLAFPLATVLVGRILSAEEMRRRAVELISASEAQFRATLYSIGDGVITTDRDGRVVQMNPVAEDFTGWREAEARGRLVDEVFVVLEEETRQPARNPALRALRDGHNVGLANHTLLVARDGTEHLIADSGAPIYVDDGAIAGVVLVFRDRSAERAAENALRESQERFVRALEHIPDVVVIYDTDLRIQFINEATRRVTGRPASYFLGRRDDEIWSPEVWEPYLPALRLALATGTTQSLDVILDLPDIGTRALQIQCVPMLDSAGKVREVLGITHDYTDQQRTANALLEEGHRFRTVFNQQFQFMALLSPEGKLLEINDLPLRVGGVSRGEVVGKYFWETIWWRDLPAMRTNWPKRLDAATRTNAPVLSIDEFQTESGEVRIAEAAVTAVKDRTGALLYFIVQATDITERQRAREELINAKNLLERTFDSMSEAVLVIDYDTRSIVRSNSAVIPVFGYTQAELQGQSTRLIHVDETLYVKFGLESALPLAMGRPYQAEFPMRRKDGVVIQTEITVRPIDIYRGWKTGVVSVVRDITERKRSEEALKKSEALLRIAGRAAKIGGWFVDLPDGVVTWSEEARAILEAPEGELLRVDEAISTYAPGSRERVAAAFFACAEQGTPYDLELELITRRDRHIWVRAIGQAVRDDEGRIIRVQGALQDIDEQKQFESTLARSQEQFHQLADAMPLIVWTAAPGGEVDFANRALSSYTGKAHAASPGRYWLDALHPDDLSRYLEVWESAVRSVKPCTHELRLMRHDGTYRWHQTKAVPILDEVGNLVRWYGTAADVHDSKMNEARLARTLESITDAFYTLDRKWRFTYVNQEAERLLGRRKEDMIGRASGQIFPELVGSDLEANYARALRENCTVEFELFYEPLARWIDVRAYPSEEGLAVYFRDITERLRAEQELRALSARLQGILDFSPLLITELDLDGRYLVASNAVCEFLGVERGALDGKLLSEVLPKETADLFMERTRQVIASRTPSVVEDQFESEGGTRDFSTLLFPLFDSRGTVVSVGGIAQEITSRRRAEADREKLELQLRQAQKMDAIGRLAGGVAHDFNNMLGVILGFTDMAVEELPEDHPAVRDLRQVQAAGRHSADLTRQLLAFARKQTIVPEVLNLNNAVESILKMLGRLIGEDIELIWRPGPDLWPVHMDPTQVDQVLANLAVNARDAIQGVGRLVIETERVGLDADYCDQHPGCAPGDYILLSVSDSGCGMAHEVQSQIFEPFFTTKPLGSGTGLGLSTVYGIVKQNKGFISVYSEPGQGSTFQIYLPCFRPPGDSVNVPQKVHGPHRGTETVLLVEDEFALLELGHRLLERLGYVVIAANGPTQALRAAVDFPDTIDLLITDVIMPEMNGRDLWLRLKALRPGLKSLFMSGYTADVIAHQGSLEEGVHFLQKPFTMAAFAQKIREAIEEERGE